MKNLDKKELILKLRDRQRLTGQEISAVFESWNEEDDDFLFQQAREVCHENYGKAVYLRGLIEVSSFCKNDCYYCGIRCSNKSAARYRLTQEEILDCCRSGYGLGFRTFVLQGGEDPRFTDDAICRVVAAIREEFPDCAITLSLGEKSRSAYRAYKEAGADRYLLRQETSDADHYRYLHPESMSMLNRQRCLYDLKDLGYQVGCGIMLGSPGQKPEHIIKDMQFMKDLEPHMIGVGPFIPHKDTKFAKEPAGTLEETLRFIAALRLIFPKALIPATTALGTIHPRGREMGLLAGANVIMPNLSPTAVRGKYLLYDGKLCTGNEAAESCRLMEERVKSVGCFVEQSRGDALV